MRKELLFCFTAFTQCVETPPCATRPPFFSGDFTTHLFVGQDINTANIVPFDPYTVFQYIFDFGIELDQEPIRETDHTLSFVARARMKGLFGNPGSGIVPLQEVGKFQIWLREAYLQYAPTSNKNIFLQAGFFPFKVGNGFVLGNAYLINIPISWQYIYEQIDQFRPGVLLRLGNEKKSVTADAYVGFIVAHNSLANPLVPPPVQNITDTALENLDAVFVQYGSKDVLASLQINIGPFDNHNFQLSPYVFFQRNDQFVEAPNDSMNTLITPGICGFYQHGDLRISFEAARNFGHQKVDALDRNLLLQADGLGNSQLFYAPNPAVTLANATDSDFVISPYILPTSIAAPYGNGGTFLYTVAPNTTFVFKNAYDRFRGEYYNKYEGYVLYLDFLLTKPNLLWALAGVYASGANDPNDAYDTILLTRLTPGVQYKDYDKKYKGFLGVNQFSDASFVNGLYFGAGDYRYTNLAFIGSTLQYSLKKEKDTLTTQGTIVSYFKPVAVMLDITTQQGITLNTPLPHYLGTEFNWSGTYSLGPDFNFSLYGGVFFAGSYYKQLHEQLTVAELATTQIFDPTVTSIPSITPQKVAYFVSFSLSWLFHSGTCAEFFTSAGSRPLPGQTRADFEERR